MALPSKFKSTSYTLLTFVNKDLTAGEHFMESKNIQISELAFQIVEHSEVMEGFDFNNYNTKSEELKYINRETISEFLKCDETSVFVRELEDGNYQLVAHNTASNETVLVNGIGNHLVALINSVRLAAKNYSKIKSGDFSEPLLTHDLIKSINERILFLRRDEAGIGKYRGLTYIGTEHKVCIFIYDPKIDSRRRINCTHLESSLNDNIKIQLDKLINFVNNKAFKSDETFMIDLAKFVARFVQIHPFGDGNGRTSRLLTNYILLSYGKNIIDIPDEKRDEYCHCISYALADSDEAFCAELDSYKEFYEKAVKKYGPRTSGDNRFLPLANFLEQCKIKNAKRYIGNIINYKKKSVLQDKFSVQIITRNNSENNQ